MSVVILVAALPTRLAHIGSRDDSQEIVDLKLPVVRLLLNVADLKPAETELQSKKSSCCDLSVIGDLEVSSSFLPLLWNSFICPDPWYELHSAWFKPMQKLKRAISCVDL